MKSFPTRVGLFLVVSALLASAAGCSKKPKNPTPLPAGRSGPPAPTSDVPLDPGTGAGRFNPNGNVSPTDLPGGGQPFTGSPTITQLPTTDITGPRDTTMFAKDTVYFDFDKANVKPQYASGIGAVADYLKSHPDTSVLIEGNCDERGTPEYNRALGERRALSVREKLLALGVNTDQVATISYGEEKPAELGTTESAYAKNRRAEFVLLTGPATTQ